MKKVWFVLAFLAFGWQLKADCPPEVGDFNFTDCNGVEYNLFELLDGGQYVVIEFHEHTEHVITTIKELYHNYGCNQRDVFVLQALPWANDEEGRTWSSANALECPVVTCDSGADSLLSLYRDCDCMGAGLFKYLFVSPDHQIYGERIDNYSNTVNMVLDSFGVLPADCNLGTCYTPEDFRAEVTPSDVCLSWTSVRDAQYYHVYHNGVFDRNVGDTVCHVGFKPGLGGDYYVVSHCEDGSECASEVVSVPPTALDFTATDCHGEEVHLFDILDRGQFVMLDFFYYTCSGCRIIIPNIVESYYRYGCNKEDIFYIEVDILDGDERCKQWCSEFGVEFPSISVDGGGSDIKALYGIQGAPNFLLIAPDHSVLYATGTGYHFDYHPSFYDLQTIVDVYEAIGIEEHFCNDDVEEDSNKEIGLFPNPADDYVNIEAQGMVQVYNGMGQLMDMFVSENQRTRVEISRYPEGLYFVQVNGKGMGKFVVKH